MSICVLVKVPEGLVLAADSASSIEGGPVLPDGNPGPPGILKVFYGATKVNQIRNFPVGVMTYGVGSFKARTISSLIQEFGNREDVRSIDDNVDELDVEKLSLAFWEFIKSKYDESFSEIPETNRPRCGFIISGYSRKDFFPEEYSLVLPQNGPTRLRPPKDNMPNFGANWFGLTDAIVRLHHGRDDRLFQILLDEGLDHAVVEKLKGVVSQHLQYPVPFWAMPISDAVDYAAFVVRTTIDRYKFVIGAPLCGGGIDIAKITRKEGFKWALNKGIVQTERGEDCG